MSLSSMVLGTNSLSGANFAVSTAHSTHSLGVKLILLDEADAMTNEAQSALRRGKHESCQETHLLVTLLPL
jgi:DNA polymerase III delta prime subunit